MGLMRSDTWQRLVGSYHGSGCTLASALAALLANGLDIPEAVREAQEYTWQTLAAAFRPGMGQHLPDRFFWARELQASDRRCQPEASGCGDSHSRSVRHHARRSCRCRSDGTGRCSHRGRCKSWCNIATSTPPLQISTLRAAALLACAAAAACRSSSMTTCELAHAHRC